ncbi:hypothetical protein MSHOH_1762 [Methanosarcina horonobensis HB-1 = JCM 15518]|uniref:DUF7343 domain-containing protein n=3 Tax=Methanosarcina horonobensis TaxID=418008 RepID=A0A0E3WTP3_9EURY|nr:hypothetical protein MSHOH_1762 [Methanosarcina horonobensis HB-1 = JCM 15518]
MPGDYVITASYYQNNTLAYSKEITLRIEDEGDYVFDLLLYPVPENGVTGIISTRINDPNGINPPEQTGTDSLNASYLSIALMLFLILGGVYKFSRKDQKTKKNRAQEGKSNMSGLLVKVLGKSTDSGIKSASGNYGKAVFLTEPVIEPGDNYDGDNSYINTAALNKQPVSPDLHEVLDIIRGHKGRITQKDLRSRLSYSEVKVSLMLSELEKRGLIKKFRNGRENIVVLVYEDPEEP